MGNNTTFKPSPLGPIPSDWEVRKFQDFAKFFSGGTPLTSIPEYYFGEIPFIKSGEIYFDKTEQFISEEGLKNSSAKLVVKGDLLYALYGANSGEVAISQINGAINQAILCIRHNSNCNTLFIYNFLLSQKESIIRNYLQGGQGNLSAEIVKSLPIPLPPLPEQRAIATCLSTWDNAITKVQAILAQKELRKKWLMQQLLTGKKRLKGFDEEWKEIKLGDYIEICSSKRVLEEDWKPSGVPFYRTREIICLSNNEEFRSPIFITENLFAELMKKNGVPKAGDILVTGVGTIGETYIVKPHDKFYFKDGNVLWFKMNKSINSSYLQHQFKTHFIRKQLSDNASITTVATYTIEGAKSTKVMLPSIHEQTAIAHVLQAADKEIQLLKAKVDRLKEEKKGLMQVLLTGKKRLNINIEIYENNK